MRCIVSYCEHESTRTSEEIMYYKFPTDPSLRTAWLEALHLADWEPEEHSVVCSNHFLKEDLMVSGDTRCALRTGAVPVNGLQACRICLAAECKLYSIRAYNILSDTYECVTGLSLHNENDLPPYLCCECTRRLLICARFRMSGVRAHKVLLDLVKNHGYITLKLIESVRDNHRLVNHSDSDDNVEIDLIENENLYNKEVSTIAPRLPEYVSVDRIKVEPDDNVNGDVRDDEDSSDDDALRISLSPELVAVDSVKVESDACYQDVRDPEDTYKDVALKLPDNVTSDDLKTETEGVMSQGKASPVDTEYGDAFADSMAVESGKSRQYSNDVEVDVGCIQTDTSIPNPYAVHPKSSAERTQEHRARRNETQVRNDVSQIQRKRPKSGAERTREYRIRKKAKVLSAGEDCSSEANPASIETKLKTALTTTSHHQPPRTKDMTRVNSDDDVEFVINNNLTRDAGSHQTNSGSQLSTDLTSRAAPHSDTFKCNMCSFITMRNHFLVRHIKTHFSVKTYLCDVCKMSFYRKDHLVRHLKVHFGKKQYACNVCGKAYLKQSRLTVHLRTHTGERPYSCNLCNKSYIRRDQHAKHMRIHAGERPYVCDVCEKAFTYRCALREHLRLHSGEKPFSCYVCCKAFAAQSALRDHLRIHSGEKPYLCNVCNKTFSQKTNLTTHLRTHSGVKPYSCHVCNKSFNQKHLVQKHLRVHSGEKPYSCNVCNKTFNQTANLSKHLRTHSRK